MAPQIPKGYRRAGSLEQVKPGYLVVDKGTGQFRPARFGEMGRVRQRVVIAPISAVICTGRVPRYSHGVESASDGDTGGKSKGKS